MGEQGVLAEKALPCHYHHHHDYYYCSTEEPYFLLWIGTVHAWDREKVLPFLSFQSEQGTRETGGYKQMGGGRVQRSEETVQSYTFGKDTEYHQLNHYQLV